MFKLISKRSTYYSLNLQQIQNKNNKTSYFKIFTILCLSLFFFEASLLFTPFLLLITLIMLTIFRKLLILLILLLLVWVSLFNNYYLYFFRLPNAWSSWKNLKDSWRWNHQGAWCRILQESQWFILRYGSGYSLVVHVENGLTTLNLDSLD